MSTSLTRGSGRSVGVVLAAMVFFVWGPLVEQGLAQDDARRRQAVPPAPTGAMSPGEVQRLLDAYTIVQAQDALSLSDTQYPEFRTRLKALQDVRRRTQRERNERLQELNRVSDPKNGPVDEGVVRDRLRSLEDLDARTAVELASAYDALDEVLDVPQRARFRVFEEQMERRKLELLTRARQGARDAQPQAR